MHALHEVCTAACHTCPEHGVRVGTHAAVCCLMSSGGSVVAARQERQLRRQLEARVKVLEKVLKLDGGGSSKARDRKSRGSSRR
jgi:hypothetical protein